MLVVASLAGWTACGSSGAPGSGATGTLLVATQGDMAVSSFQVDLDKGGLSHHSAGVSTGAGSFPIAMVITPDGNTAFVANQGSNDIASFTISSDGTLSSGGVNQAIVGGSNPVSLAVDPSGAFLFVANQGSDNISVYAISGATLTEVASSPFAVDPDPSAVVVAPNLDVLYVANNMNATVAAYEFDPATGALTMPVPGSPYATGGIAPSGLATAVTTFSGGTPGGTFLYTANAGSNNVSGFIICAAVTTTCPVADGSLIPVGAPFSAQLGPVALAATPGGEFLYVVDKGSNQVSSYTISAGTGALTATSPATISTGLTPVAIGLPSGGGLVYVANFGAASVSNYRIVKDANGTPTGALQLVAGPVSCAGQPAAVALK
jgi:6-phosphogluconolactonase (cycloisomerase 2 family)